MKQLNKYKSILVDFIFYLAILFFIIGFNFSDNMAGGWYQQFMPSMGSKTIKDITILDSLTGYAVANNYPSDSNYVLKTTNGGDNWQIIHRQYLSMQHIQFLNLNTGYSCAGYLYKTTNSGFNWNPVNTSGISAGNMYVHNQDTIWLVDADGFVGGIFRTTNGGANWQTQLSNGSNPDKIYMYKGRFGFANRNGGSFTYRTTNSGLNWDVVSGTDGFSDIYFVDTLVGWKAYGNMKKTTDGGLNWVTQVLPSGGDIQVTSMYEFENINKDTIWGVGGQILKGSIKGMIYRTTNSGTNWLFEVPNISPNIPQYIYSDFINKLNGWSYTDINRGIHTTTGGGDTFYTSVKQISINIPYKFYLGQNYPNPFNPVTKVKYQITSNEKHQISNVKITIYDIRGKEIGRLVDEEQIAGTYEVDFDGTNYSSGIYFYSLIIDGKLIDTKKMILLK